MKKDPSAVPTILAVIFGVLLLGTGYMWLTTEKKLEQTLAYGADSVGFQEHKIKTECGASDIESQNACSESINALNTLISEVQKTRGGNTNTVTGTGE